MTRSRTTRIVRLTRAREFAALIFGLAFATGVVPLARANPVGPIVVNGAASFATSGNTLAVTNTPGAIINWQQFNISQNEITKFIQLSPQSSVLNRITGQEPSQIFGTLQSNGKVLLINPNGVVFGPNASVDVFGLIVSNLNLANADFLSGRYQFNGGGFGTVVNRGTITTPVGGSVYLVGNHVSNSGIITSPKGDVLLAAGNAVTLADTGTPAMSVTLKASDNRAVNLGQINAGGGSIDIYGALINQQGILRADSATVNEQGRIVLKAARSVDLAGAMSTANSAGNGGSVQVLGDRVTLAATAKIDASGATGGGTVLVGGDQQGSNAAVQNATTTTVATGASIKADAVDNGNGGKVIVWSNDTTTFDGFVSAKGGANGGDGGFVETSGKTLASSGRVDTTAANGNTGSWLLDPASYCFFVSSSSECTSRGINATNGTSIANLDSLLLTSNATLAATDFIYYLPAGGSYLIGSSVPSGRTLTVQAPSITFGPNGHFNSRNIALNLDASSQYGTASNGSTGSLNIFGQVTSSASQTIKAESSLMIGGNRNDYSGGLSMTSSTGTQTVTVGGDLSVNSGTGNVQGSITPISAWITSFGAQTISANTINLNAGSGANTPAAATATSAGLGNTAYISGATQTITASAINLTAGASGANNGVNLFTTGGAGTQKITASSITLKAGNSGSWNYAGIHSNGTDGSQDITTSSLTLIGGKGGANNWAHLSAGNANSTPVTQKISAATISLSGGGALSTDQNDDAAIVSNGSQTVQATAIDLTGGVAGMNNSAQIESNGPGTQKITATTGIAIKGGNSGYGNYAEISASGANKTQDITAPSLILSGGKTGTGNTAGLWVSYSGATPSPVTQKIAATTITLSGGGSLGSDLDDDAIIGSRGSQTLQAATIAMTGGAGPRAGAYIQAFGTQNITLTGSGDVLTMRGGGSTANDYDDAVEISQNSPISGSQTITFTGTNANVVLKAGAGSSGSSQYGTVANCGASCVGKTSWNVARISNAFGYQTLDFQQGGSLSLYGGVNGRYNFAGIDNLAGNQTISFGQSNGGSLSLYGGSYGGFNGARIWNQSAGLQLINNRPAVTLVGGDTGGLVTQSATEAFFSGSFIRMGANSAVIASGKATRDLETGLVAQDSSLVSGTQSILASEIVLKGTSLSGKASGISGAGLFSASDQSIDVTGALTLVGGDSTGQSRTRVWSMGGTQTINADSLSVAGATSVDRGYDNLATVGSWGQQFITLGHANGPAMTLTTNSATATNVLNNGAGGGQTLKFTGANAELRITGPAAGLGTNNANAPGDQSIQFTKGGSVVLAGIGTADPDSCCAPNIGSFGKQSITGVSSIALTGGSTSHGGAFITAVGDQYIETNRLSLLGGSGANTDTSAVAIEHGSATGELPGSGNQTIVLTGASPSLTLTGGSGAGTGDTTSANCGSGGCSSNFAAISNYGSSNQSITFSGTAPAIVLAGGSGGRSNYAGIDNSAGTQTISINSAILTAGTTGIDNAARITSSGAQSITLRGSGNVLSLIGGGSTSGDSGNSAEIFHASNSLNGSVTGSQTITLTGNGAALKLQAGSGSGMGAQSGDCLNYGAASLCNASRNNAEIYDQGTGTQTLDFKQSGGSISIIGGSRGVQNIAAIDTESSLKVSGYPDITLRSASSGGAAVYLASAPWPGVIPSLGNDVLLGGGEGTADIAANNVTIDASAAAAGTVSHVFLGSGGGLTLNAMGNLGIMGGSGTPVNVLNYATSPYQDTFATGTLIGGLSGPANLNVSGNLSIVGGTGSAGQIVIGNLIAASGSGTAVPAGNSALNSLTVGAATTITAPTSPVLFGFGGSATAPTGIIQQANGAVLLGIGAGAFNTGSFVSASKTFDLYGTINANGSPRPVNPKLFTPWDLSADLVSEVYVTNGFANHGGAISTPNGSWMVTLGNGVAGAANVIGFGPLSYADLKSLGYFWNQAAYESANGSSFHFYTNAKAGLPPSLPSVVLSVDSGISATDRITNNPELSVSGAPSGITRRFSLDGGAPATTYSAPTTDGNHTVVVTDTNAIGKSVSASLGFTLDKTIAAPSVTLASDSGISATDGITNNAALTVSPTASGITRSYKVDSAAPASSYASPNTSGAHTVVVTDSDPAGNTSASSVSFTLYTSLPAPTVALSAVTGADSGSHVTNNAVLTVSPPASSVVARTYSVDGSLPETAYTPPTANGTHTVVVTDRDVAGNTASSSLSFTLQSEIITKAVSDTCASNALLCTTTSTATQSVSPSLGAGMTTATTQSQVSYDTKIQVAEVKATDSKPATVDSKPAATESKVDSSAKPTIVAEDKPAVTASASAPAAASGKAVLAGAQAADAGKTSVELKAEAQQASTEAKQIVVEAKQATVEAKQAAGVVKVAVAEAKKAETQVKEADSTARKADAEARQAESEVKAAQTPEQKVRAETRKVQAEARRAEAEANKAEAEAKKPEAEAKQASAEAKQVSAEAKQAQAAAKQAEAEAKQASAEAKEARNPAQKLAAERRADEKRVETIQRKAEAEVKQAKAEVKQAEAEAKHAQAEAKKSEAVARQSEAEAKHAEVDKSPAKRVEAEVRKAENELRKVESEVKKIQSEVKKAEAEMKVAKTPEQKLAAESKYKAAENRKAEVEAQRAERKSEADTKKGELAKASDRKALIEAKKAEVETKQKSAEAKKVEAETKLAAQERRQEERRAEVAKAFGRTIAGTVSYEKLAEISAIRHEIKTDLFKPALTILEQDPKAADLPPCGAGGDVCVPVKASVAEVAGKLAAQVTGALPKPTMVSVPQIERKLAVIIGINNYASKSIPTLESAVADAEAVSDLLRDKMGYEVRVMRDASRAEIVKSLNAVAQEVGANDSITVYYAGHGYLLEQGSEKLGYWIPSDAEITSPKQWLSNTDIAKLLGNIPAKQVMLVSDSCYSGALVGNNKVSADVADKQPQEILRQRSVAMMSSGGEEPVSDEGKEGHSIFAWTLINALKKVDNYQLGVQLFDSVRQGVLDDFPQVPQYGASTAAGHTAGGDYLFETRSYK